MQCALEGKVPEEVEAQPEPEEPENKEPIDPKTLKMMDWRRIEVFDKPVFLHITD